MERALTKSRWSPGLGGCGVLVCRRYKTFEGPFRAGKALGRHLPHRSSRLALGQARALKASLKQPSLRWSPRWSQSLRRTRRKIPGDPGLLKQLCSKQKVQPDSWCYSNPLCLCLIPK